MKVFISQSLPRSLALAQAFEVFVRRVIPGTEPWVSDRGIDKGARFMSEIRANLNAAAAGVVCLTQENLTEPWILYEAGALSTKVTDRVWTVLLDVHYTSVAAPLTGFNHTKAERDDVMKLVKSIHKAVIVAGEKTYAESDLNAAFDAFWPDLQKTVERLRLEGPAAQPPVDPQTEMLGLIRVIAQRVTNDGWKHEKTLRLLQVMYTSVIGSIPPSLEALQHVVALQGVEAKAEVGNVAASMGRQPQYSSTPLPLRNQATQEPVNRPFPNEGSS